MSLVRSDAYANAANDGAPDFPFGATFGGASVLSGTYTPSVASLINTATYTPGVCMYTILDNVWTVAGTIAYSSVGSADLLSLRASLPTAITDLFTTGFDSSADVAGTGVSLVTTLNHAWRVDANTANDEIAMAANLDADDGDATIRFFCMGRIK